MKRVVSSPRTCTGSWERPAESQSGRRERRRPISTGSHKRNTNTINHESRRSTSAAACPPGLGRLQGSEAHGPQNWTLDFPSPSLPPLLRPRCKDKTGGFSKCIPRHLSLFSCQTAQLIIASSVLIWETLVFTSAVLLFLQFI